MSVLVDEIRAARRFRPEQAKAIREAVGVSQQRLADELGVNRVTLARWELRQRSPRGELLVRYMDLLDSLGKEAFG